MASEYTPNRRYPLYTDNDKPNLRDQYNGAIREIDTDMAQALADSSAVATALGAGFDAQHTVRMALEEKATSTALANEVSARESADSALGTRITNETTAREGADTALGTRITNETSAREGADSALGTRITNETTARQAADTALDARIDSLEAQKHMVIIGDSFSSTDFQPANTAWYTLVASQLKVTPHCFAKSAAGFVAVGAGNNTFYSELELANDDTSFNNADVEWLFIYGGLNDMTVDNYNAAFSSAFKNTVNRAKQLFPNARLIVMGVNSWPESLQAVTINNQVKTQIQAEFAIMSMQDNTDVAPYAFIPMALIFGFNARYYDASNRHPNSTGHHYVASIVLNSLSGDCIEPIFTIPAVLYDSQNNEIGNCSISRITARSFRVNGNVNFAQAGQITPHDSKNFLGGQGISFGAGQVLVFGNASGVSCGYANASSLFSAGNTGTCYFNLIVYI